MKIDQCPGRGHTEKMQPRLSSPQATTKQRSGPVVAVLLAVSFAHLLNDTVQAVIPAIYPLLKESFQLSFGQVGLITLTFQLTASILQPIVGLYADHRPVPFSLATGMGVTLVGLILLSVAGSYALLLIAAALVGLGSSIFHPEASRVARLASGGKHGLAQSLFQVGGNAGTSFGPLLAAIIVVPYGQANIGWFTLAAFVGIIVLVWIGRWYQQRLAGSQMTTSGAQSGAIRWTLPRRQIAGGVLVLIALVFSKYFYLASMSSYYTFFLIEKFSLSVRDAQLHLFIFLAAIAAGTFLGGPVGDRIGRKAVIWVSILGVAPFALALPYANLFWCAVLSAIIGLILASAFSAILVYSQELVPGKVGTMSGLFFGLAFGLGGIGSALLGAMADRHGIPFVFHVCSYLPLIGLFTAFLPNLGTPRRAASTSATP